jgi:anthranilate phosphoribosyltransferase
MQTILEDLYRGKHLDQQRTMGAIKRIMRGELNETEISALLIALKMKGENPQEIAGAARALRESATPFSRPEGQILDTCGTGGDGFGTINISTVVGLVAAECGVKVAKHGNRAVSSLSGSSDLLSKLGVKLDCSPKQSRRCLDTLNFCFLMAPQYHQGVRFAMPVRQKLKTRTLFNLIGPLANPAVPDVQLMGVYDNKLLLPMAEALHSLGCKRAFVVNGGGMDEIALHTETIVAYLNEGRIRKIVIKPEQAGLKRTSLNAVQLDNPDDIASASIEVMSGGGKEAHRQIVALNTAAALFLCDKTDNLEEGVEMALGVLASGRVATRLQAFAEMSHG